MPDNDAQQSSSRPPVKLRGKPGCPVWEGIYQYLLDNIRNRTFAPGDPIPTEIELQRMFHVSRPTIRQALTRLQTEGLIIRKQGMGSFVKRQPPNNAWTRASGFASYYREKWTQLTMEVLEWGTISPPSDVAAFFESPAGTKLSRALRMRRDRGHPIILLEEWFIEEFRGMDLRDPNESGAILGFMRKHGVRLKKAEETIEAIHLPPQQARTLSVPEGIPALYIERRCLNEQEQPADFTKYWIPAGTWKYHASITL